MAKAAEAWRTEGVKPAEGIQVEVAEIPPLPRAVDVVVPLVGDPGDDAETKSLAVLGGDAVVTLPDLDLDKHLIKLPMTTPGDANSLLHPGGGWAVQDLIEKDGQVEISLGRRGRRETSLRVPRRRLGGIKKGSRFAAPSKKIYEEKSFFWGPKVRVEFRRDPGSGPHESDILLPILRLHCPSHPGCEAQYSIANTKGANGTMELSILGIGGGGGKALACTVSQIYSTREQCMEIAIPARLELQLGSTFVNGTQVAYGMQATIKDVDTDHLKQRPLGPDHGCGVPHDRVEEVLWGLDRCDEGDGQPNSVYAEKLNKETEGKLSVALEFGNAPLKLGFDYVRKVSSEIEITTGVSPGARYTAYPPPGGGEFEIFWAA